MPVGKHRVDLRYANTVERTHGGNSATFEDDAGHVRNQYFWHPFFGFGDEASMASFRVRASIPARYRLALDLPQTERVEGDRRIVDAASPAGTAALTFAYDAGWQPTTVDARGVTLTLFANPDFTPARDVIEKTFKDTIEALQARFGPPPMHNIKIVQQRARGDTGWLYLSNQAIFAGSKGGRPSRAPGYAVRSFLGHEISHLWTRPVGPATNFLMEGWATYAEALLVGREYGADATDLFWRDQQRLLLINDDAMKSAMARDSTNSGVSYMKGAWLLRMIERIVSPERFDQAIRNFIARPAGQTRYEDFIAAFGPDAKMVGRFAEPWYSQAGLPDISITRTADTLVISQAGTTYWLPGLTLRMIAQDGTSTLRKVDVTGPKTVIPLAGDRPVRIELDPFGDYLLPKRFLTIGT
jgi:hypothetical protein